MQRIPLVKDMLVKTLLSAKQHQGVESLTVDNSIREAAQFMRTKGISSVLVIGNEKPMGVITERDISNSVANQTDAQSILSSIMTPWEKVKTVSVGATVGEAQNSMIKLGVRHIPVSDNQGVIVGVISQRDINDAYYKNEVLIATQSQ